MTHTRSCMLAGAALLMSMPSPALASGGDSGSIVPELTPTPTVMASTIPRNGDLNPYGVAFVPEGFPGGGPLREGDILVSNFNDSENQQGTGTTIVRITPEGDQSLFFQDGAAPGLSTALGVLKSGFVLVGNVPSVNGSKSGVGVCSDLQLDVGPGALLVLDRHGAVVQVFTSQTFFNGPWDLTIVDEGSHAQLFVSNVLSGTVSRLDLQIRGDGDAPKDASGDPIFVDTATLIASGYTHRCDPAAFVVGPTGLALDEHTDTLYVASTGDNTIFAVPHASHRQTDAGTGINVVPDEVAGKHLHGPLALLLAPNGDLVTSQGDAVNVDPDQPSEIVELTPQGRFVDQISIDPAVGGGFGIALSVRRDGFRFAAVDDNANTLDIWDVR